MCPTLASLVVGLSACALPAHAPDAIEAPAPAMTVDGSPGGARAIEVGPGPTAVYRVEPQPAPGSCHYTYVGADALPDSRCTPGAVSPQVTEATIGRTICRSGYASSVRPPERVTDAEKAASAVAYGYTGSFRTAEYDHLIPLELGGDPDDPADLWVEPNDLPRPTSTANGKDLLEDRLNHLVCSGRLGVVTAQRAIATDWVAAARKYLRS